MRIATHYKYIWLIFFLFIGFFAQAQEKYTIEGIVTSTTGELLIGAGIQVLGTNKSTLTDAEGKFKIQEIGAGDHKISVRYLGYVESVQKLVLVGTPVIRQLKFNLKSIHNDLAEVVVMGRTAVKEVNRQAFNVTAVDATKLYNTTMDISSALDRVAGVRVRETGGVGSSFNISLNGFSGKHIRYFIDGIPMDNFGSSFQINNIPINVAERVEVYKGVVPMWLGSDALGGAVNIVTGNKHRNYVDASYSYGSFNTHRGVINAAATSKSGFTVQVSAFQNYSDNNYKVQLPSRLTNVQGPEISLPRFHDVYHNETLIANVGVIDKSFADNLLFGITMGQNYKEMQTGARPDEVFGAFHRRGNIVMPSLKYKKTNLIKGMDVTINANYNLGFERNIDTARASYNWYGVRTPKAAYGERAHTDAKYYNHNGLATAMVSYKISERHSVAINNVFSTFNRETKDLLIPANDKLDPAKKMDKNVLGFGYSYDIDNKWSANFFGKYIYQNNIIESKNLNNVTEKIGYGFAIAYFFNPNLQVRTSYEMANRMPEATEIFGDLENQDPNPTLKPEKSDNFNIGMVYGFSLNKEHRFSVTANGIYRYSSDFIYNTINLLSKAQGKTISNNKEGVSTIGVDGEVRYSYKNWLSIGGTMTYQYLQNLQKYEDGYTSESDVYLDQMPNIPYLFGNLDASVSLRDIGKKGNHLTVGYNLLYVNQFWLYWPSLGSSNMADKNGIPTQLAHDVNLVYSMKNGRYNISLEAKNLTDKPLYDNFSLQKPGRGFYLNLRYFFNKNQQ
ncbi:TonB-dependent receptor [Pedobacter hiemivivus]|uniref:TonB-dependent receptor n=1 Tax=Pedobacter hiemivivus TaxID=2530454 RepID=A0A4R0ND02_9SPHI|nr:TonB-dependent receptor [Pedobacter hiemivivus]TCC97113.1 TonB-dependent receptor [Pedobacter hiemivivus]